MRTRADLGRELTALRTAAGLTVRELARRLNTPPATLGDYFAGRHLPKLSQLDLYRSIVTECGVSAPDDLERWAQALDRARLTSDGRAAKGIAPYRGLEPFGEADAELFFGREAATNELVGRLRQLWDDPGPSGGVLVLVGPSGSGKSSLLGAGLVPAVRAGALDTSGTSWTCQPATPADAADLLQAPAAPDGTHLLLVVDQVEDALAGSSLSGVRSVLLEALARPDRAPSLVVLGLRADYYGEAAGEPVLLAALRHAQVLLGPLTEPEVREAIAGPARAVGATTEDGLVDLVLADLAPGSPTGFAHDAGALPLLSHALLVAWQRAERNQLTIADYRTVGGLRGAVRQSAEELYRSLDPAEQVLARRMFGRLVRIEGDGPLTRRRVHRRELTALHERAEGVSTFDRVLERFVAARLVTADAEHVQISHDALLGA
ncbi:MAG: helix-turn-helix domain-containing protein [Acidimicrobiales bacterium]